MWLWGAMTASGALSERRLVGAGASLPLSELAKASSLGDRLEELRGRSVLILAPDPFTAAVVLVELDGVARRIVLCPSDLPATHFPQIVREAGCDAWVGDSDTDVAALGVRTLVVPGAAVADDVQRRWTQETEWVLLTSGTTGAPKLVLHTLATLTNAFAQKGPPAPGAVWSTFYDIRRYGGLQVLLRGLLGGSLVLSSPNESVADFLARAAAAGVTHVSGTPSHWRQALMSGALSRINPWYVRMSGEIADQAVLDGLRRVFPEAVVAHAFASTEAGVGFEVQDGQAGFPAILIGAPNGPAEIAVAEGRLKLRSRGSALCYLGTDTAPLKAADGFVDTGDLLELRDDRYHFMGRSGGVINVGGRKVHPEEVEAVINSLPWVHICRVAARKNPITGAVVAADVVRRSVAGCRGELSNEELKLAIIDACRTALAAHKVPASIRFVPTLEVGPSGKLVRANA
jgi:acyl-coenzyme A synthetase/AMP-(fatty) acid ligase